MEKGEGERRKGLGTYIQQALVGSLVVVVIRVAGKGGRGTMRWAKRQLNDEALHPLASSTSSPLHLALPFLSTNTNHFLHSSSTISHTTSPSPGQQKGLPSH